MKNSTIAILLSLISTSFFVEAAETPCGKERMILPMGFGTGDMYLKMTVAEKRAYGMGALDAMLIAPVFGAPEKCTKWLEDYTAGMTAEQVAAIITKFLNDNPGGWHERLNVLVYNALREAYNKQHPDER